jgi:predicted nuclease with TOPRIM domain
MTEAERLSRALEVLYCTTTAAKEAAALIRSQAAEIEALQGQLRVKAKPGAFEDLQAENEALRVNVALKNGQVTALQDEANDLRVSNDKLVAMLKCVETNLSKSMSKSIQRLQARQIAEVLHDAAIKGEPT